MNKLEEYKDKRAESHKDAVYSLYEWDDYSGLFVSEGSFKSGFDAAIALDLPVKFELYLQNLYAADGDARNYPFTWVAVDEWDVHSDLYELPKRITTKELFDYWLNNIWEGK